LKAAWFLSIPCSLWKVKTWFQAFAFSRVNSVPRTHRAEGGGAEAKARGWRLGQIHGMGGEIFTFIGQTKGLGGEKKSNKQKPNKKFASLTRPLALTRLRLPIETPV
jgi:hypothetical protein